MLYLISVTVSKSINNPANPLIIQIPVQTKINAAIKHALAIELIKTFYCCCVKMFNKFTPY
jgi:hypothetical protein